MITSNLLIFPNNFVPFFMRFVRSHYFSPAGTESEVRSLKWVIICNSTALLWSVESPVQPGLSAGWSESDYSSELLRGRDYFSLSTSQDLATSQHHTQPSPAELNNINQAGSEGKEEKYLIRDGIFICWSLQGDLVTQLFWTLLIRQNSKQSLNIFNWRVLPLGSCLKL